MIMYKKDKGLYSKCKMKIFLQKEQILAGKKLNTYLPIKYSNVIISFTSEYSSFRLQKRKTHYFPITIPREQYTLTITVVL